MHTWCAQWMVKWLRKKNNIILKLHKQIDQHSNGVTSVQSQLLMKRMRRSASLAFLFAERNASFVRQCRLCQTATVAPSVSRAWRREDIHTKCRFASFFNSSACTVDFARTNKRRNVKKRTISITKRMSVLHFLRTFLSTQLSAQQAPPCKRLRSTSGSRSVRFTPNGNVDAVGADYRSIFAYFWLSYGLFPSAGS